MKTFKQEQDEQKEADAAQRESQNRSDEEKEGIWDPNKESGSAQSASGLGAAKAQSSPAPTISSENWVKRDLLMSILVSGLKIEVKDAEDPGSTAERIIRLVEELHQKAKARGWFDQSA